MSDEVDEALLDVTVAEPHHLLVLPTDVTLGEVEALALSHFDDAGIHDDATLHITGGARLTGPWRLGSAQRDALDLPSWAATALVLRCPVQRSAPVPPALLGGGGLRDAFPDGEPLGLESEVLHHLLAQARRLGAGLRTAGSGALLAPDPASAIDLTLYAPVWLEPTACQAVLEEVLGTMASSLDLELPAPGSAALSGEHAALRERAVEEMDSGERGWLHAEADALDAEMLHRQQPLAGYALLAASGSNEEDHIEVGVAGDAHIPAVLRYEDWVRRGLITYEIRWRPHDPGLALGPRPPLGLRRRRDEARTFIEQAGAVLHQQTGGQLLDDDGFLVDATAF